MVPLKGSIAKTRHCLNKIAGDMARRASRFRAMAAALQAIGRNGAQFATQTEAFLSYLQE